MFDLSTYAHSFFSCLMYLSMVSHPFGCFMLIWSVAVERSVRVSGVSFVFPKTSSLRAIADCHSSVISPRRLRLCMRYASWRLLFDFRTPFSLQAKKSLSILGDMQVVNNWISLMQAVRISICSSVKSDWNGFVPLPTMTGFLFCSQGSSFIKMKSEIDRFVPLSIQFVLFLPWDILRIVHIELHQQDTRASAGHHYIRCVSQCISHIQTKIQRMRHISVFVLWSVIQRRSFPTRSHHRCNIPLHMQEQDDSDKWKIVHRLFGYILFVKSLGTVYYWCNSSSSEYFQWAHCRSE